jgi:CheY-like chemotaxis protein
MQPRKDDEQAALAAGFDRHIPKPVDEGRLVDVITETLKRHVA